MPRRAEPITIAMEKHSGERLALLEGGISPKRLAKVNRQFHRLGKKVVLPPSYGVPALRVVGEDGDAFVARPKEHHTALRRRHGAPPAEECLLLGVLDELAVIYREIAQQRRRGYA